MARLATKGRTGKRPFVEPAVSEPNGDKALDQPERGPGTANAAPAARVRVSVDMLVVRTDLHPSAVSTFVTAGDLIPIGLEGFPRVPA